MQEKDLKNFYIVDNFSAGFKDKKDVVKEGKGVAVSGSQNIITVDGEKIGVRPGFSYRGTRSTDRYGIQGGGNWKTSSNTEIEWRSFLSDTTDGNIQAYIGGVYETVIDSLTYGKFRSAIWWSATETKDLLILVNGQDKIWSWSGANTTYLSDTSNTLTKQGTTTWAESRFLVAGTRKVRIKDDSDVWQEFTYTGGEGTTTLTGVTPDPTALSLTAGAKCIQSLTENDNKPADGLANDFVAVYKNYLFVFDEENMVVEMSKNTDFTDFTSPTSPRLPGEAADFNLDEVPTAFALQPDGSSLYISTKNQWYQFTFTASADLTKEAITIEPLKTSPLEGATNSLATTNAKNNVVTVSGEPTIDTLGRVESIDTEQSTAFSDPIKNYMDSAGVASAATFYYKNNQYTALKEDTDDGVNNRILTRNFSQGSWETPWTLPASVIYEAGGKLYSLDPATTNTYQLLDGYSDGWQKDAAGGTAVAGAPIAAKWFSAHLDYGKPHNQKVFDTMWVEGYIRAGTKLEIAINYDFGSEILKFSLLGTKDDVVLSPDGGGLGYYSLGTRNLGGSSETLAATGLKRFRGFIKLSERPFYEMQTAFASTGVDYRWEVNSYGQNIRIINGQNNNLLIN